jgi:hypothetical protein
MFKITSLVIIAGLASGCAPEHFSVTAHPEQSNSKPDGDFQAQGCAPDSTDYNMQVNVVSFAMTSKTDVEFGFKYDLGWFKGIELGAHIKKGELELQMELARPLKPFNIEKVGGKGKLSDNSFSFKVDTTIVNAGINTAAQTSLAKLSRKGFKDLLTNASALLKKDPNGWQTTVQAFDDEQHFKIPTGFKAGLQKGDQFNIFEEKWIWKGSPCSSEVDRHYHVSNTPIATAIVWDVEDESATLQIVGTPIKKLKLGDTVEIAKLVKLKKSDKRNLKKSVRLLPAFSKGKLVINNLGEIDVPYYLDYVMHPALNDSEFWVVPK